MSFEVSGLPGSWVAYGSLHVVYVVASVCGWQQGEEVVSAGTQYGVVYGVVQGHPVAGVWVFGCAEDLFDLPGCEACVGWRGVGCADYGAFYVCGFSVCTETDCVYGCVRYGQGVGGPERSWCCPASEERGVAMCVVGGWRYAQGEDGILACAVKVGGGGENCLGRCSRGSQGK